MYTENQTMAKYCIGCGEQIHPKRVEILPNTKTCVGCSTTGAKRGIPVLHGNVEKDDTWVDMVFMEPEEFEAYEQSTGRLKNLNHSASKPELQDFDKDDNITFDVNHIEEE
jgi:hypothetical protein